MSVFYCTNYPYSFSEKVEMLTSIYTTESAAYEQ